MLPRYFVVLAILFQRAVYTQINCVSELSPVSTTTDGAETSVTCSNSAHTLVSCGHRPVSNTITMYRGSWISGQTCYAKNGVVPDAVGVYAVARCCDLSAYSASCTTSETGPVSGNDVLTTATCSAAEVLMGCTVKNVGKFSDGCYPQSVGTNLDSCTAQSDWGGGNTYGYATCCVSGNTAYMFQCEDVAKSATSSSTYTFSCPDTDQFMTACTAKTSWGQINGWEVTSSNQCKITQYPAQTIQPHAICCRVVLTNPTPNPTPRPTPNPTPSPSDHPTPAPTNDPTSPPTPAPTFNPSFGPTSDPTIAPTAAPFVPTTAPSDPTDDPTLGPSDEPSKSPVKEAKVQEDGRVDDDDADDADDDDDGDESSIAEEQNNRLQQLLHSSMVIYVFTGTMGAICLFCALLLCYLSCIQRRQKIVLEVEKMASMSSGEVQSDVNMQWRGMPPPNTHNVMVKPNYAQGSDFVGEIEEKIEDDGVVNAQKVDGIQSQYVLSTLGNMDNNNENQDVQMEYSEESDDDSSGSLYDRDNDDGVTSGASAGVTAGVNY